MGPSVCGSPGNGRWTRPQRAASVAALSFNLGSVAGYVVFGILADTVGRKPTIRLFYLGALALSYVFFVRVGDWPALITAATVLGFFASGQFAWMTIDLPEQFPTGLRGSAISLVFDGSRSVAACGPLVAGWFASVFGGIGRAAAPMSLVYIIGLAVTPFVGRETRGTALVS